MAEELGGLEKMAEINRRKADKLYALIDDSGFYATRRENQPFADERSFYAGGRRAGQRFLEEAEAEQLLNLKGHRSVGGMRASLYNAVKSHR